jgi:hypothetical protein
MTALAQDRNTPRKYVERFLAEDALDRRDHDRLQRLARRGQRERRAPSRADVAEHHGARRRAAKMVNATGAAAKVTPKAKVAAGVLQVQDDGRQRDHRGRHRQELLRARRPDGRAHRRHVNAIVAGVVDSMDPDGDVWVKVNC